VLHAQFPSRPIHKATRRGTYYCRLDTWNANALRTSTCAEDCMQLPCWSTLAFYVWAWSAAPRQASGAGAPSQRRDDRDVFLVFTMIVSTASFRLRMLNTVCEDSQPGVRQHSAAYFENRSVRLVLVVPSTCLCCGGSRRCCESSPSVEYIKRSRMPPLLTAKQSIVDSRKQSRNHQHFRA
jgi:hypothetical protein